MTNYDSAMITGAAGFIGSHMADKLLEMEVNVTAVDNFSSGKTENLNNCKKSKSFHLIKEDLKNSDNLSSFLQNIDTVFHLAAYPEVRTGFENPEISFRENIENTYKFLENIRKSNVQSIIFSSSSVVYGEPNTIPTNENFGPLLPISPYGGSKLACEGLISSYCHNYGLKGTIIRFANVIGKRSNHGVIWDFIHKLKKDPTKLEVLGDGTQMKSYIHIKDCIEGILSSYNFTNKQVDVFNIGNNDQLDVLSIAKIVSEEMQLSDAQIVTSGGTSDGRGWIGDVKKMQLDISKLKNLGWEPKLSSKLAVRKSVKELIDQIN